MWTDTHCIIVVRSVDSARRSLSHSTYQKGGQWPVELCHCILEVNYTLTQNISLVVLISLGCGINQRTLCIKIIQGWAAWPLADRRHTHHNIIGIAAHTIDRPETGWERRSQGIRDPLSTSAEGSVT